MDKSLTFKLVKSIQEIGTGKKCTRGKIYNNNSKTFFCACTYRYSVHYIHHNHKLHIMKQAPNASKSRVFNILRFHKLTKCSR